MKKLLLAVVVIMLALGSTNTAQAQDNPFGFHIGINSANFVDRPSGTQTDPRTGMLVGIYLTYQLPAIPVSIQPETLYSQKGFKSGNTTLKIDYLEVPVLVKVNFGSGRIQPHVYAGPYFGFPINSKLEGSNATFQVDNVETDIGVVLGAGTDVMVGLTKLDLGARYSFGRDDAIQNTPGKNSVFSIVAGVKL